MLCIVCTRRAAQSEDRGLHYLHFVLDRIIQAKRNEQARTVLEGLRQFIATSKYLEPGNEAARASARIIERDGLRFGYVRFWLISQRGPTRLLRELINGAFADCNGLLLDLRGRGGLLDEAQRLIRDLDPVDGIWRRPLVVLTHGETRSAKEIIAHELKESGAALLVGEPTAGAVIPATFAAVGEEAVLMYPSSSLSSYTQALEGHPVQPHVHVNDSLAYSRGADSIREAGIATLLWLYAEIGRRSGESPRSTVQ